MPFRAIIGHRRALELLQRSVARQTLAPSLLFSGPEGVGKRLTAVALAQALNCQQPFEGDACGACSACSRIARGIHADVLVVEPGETGNIRIDTARDAIDRAMYRPFEGRRRVVVFDDAEALVPAAQHALLKTLEEPSPSSVFVLVTAHPELLVDTVRSRCARVRFGRLSEPEIVEALVRDHAYSEADAREVAPLADGSVGRALEASTDEVAAARRAARAALDVAAGADAKAKLGAAERLLPAKKKSAADERAHLATHLRALSSMLRDVGLLTARADTRVVANVDFQAGLARLVPAFPPDRVVGAFTAVDRALEALDRNANPRIVADWVMLRI